MVRPRWRHPWILLLLALSAVVSDAFAVPVGQSALDEYAGWRRMGLEIRWSQPADLDPGSDRLALLQIRKTATAFKAFEVVSELGTQSYSERDLNRFGTLLGTDGAKRAAEQRVRDLKAMEYQPELRETTVNDARLLLQSSQGTVQAVDAETGQPQWTVKLAEVGDAQFKIDANNSYVAGVTGNSLIVLDAETGATRWRQRLPGPPITGPVLSDRMALVPLLDGRILGYWLPHRPERDFEGTVVDWPAAKFVTYGRISGRPTVAGNLAAWSTERGTVQVSSLDPVRLTHQVSMSPVLAPATFRGQEKFVVVDEAGYVYCADPRRSRRLWQASTGRTIRLRPLLFGDRIYLTSYDGHLICLDAESGATIWTVSDVAQVLSVAQEKIYVQTVSGAVAVLQSGDGQLISRFVTSIYDKSLSNAISDRVYLASATGRIVCLGAAAQRWPYFHPQPDLDETPTEESKQPEPTIDTGDDRSLNEPDDGAANPFDPGGGSDDNPFGSDEAGGNDPFGAGDDTEDPFGTSDDAGADPFGTGDN